MSYIKNSFFTLVSNVTMIFIGFFTSFIISRNLGADLQGVFNLAVLMPTMLYNFMNFGQDTAVMYFLSNKSAKKKDAVNNMITVTIIYSVASLVIGGLLIVLLKERLFTEVSYNLLIMALIISPLTFLNNNLLAVMKSEGKFKDVNKIQVLNKIIYLIICTVLFFIVKVEIVIFGNIFILLVSIVSLWRRLEIHKVKLSFDKEYQKRNINYGFKSYLANMITFLNYRLDTLLIQGITNNLAMVGQYGVAVTLAEQVWILASAVSSVMFPYLTSIESDEDKTKVTAMTLKVVMIFTFLAIVVLFLFANVIGFIYGPDFYGSILPFKILLIGIFSLSLGKILANDIAARGKPELNAFSNLVGLVFNVTFNIILIPKYGIVGAAIATSISYTITSSLFIISFLRLTKMKATALFLFSKDERKIAFEFVQKKLLKK